MSAKQKPHVKRDDMVEVIAGKEKGKRGKVLKVMPSQQRAVIEKINMIKKHSRPGRQSQQGGIIEMEGTLHISNLMVVCQRCNRPVRVGRMRLQDGGGARYCKSCGELID